MRAFFGAAIVGCASAFTQSLVDDFLRYAIEYGKNYKSIEEAVMRQERWEEAEAYIREVNESNASWTAGHNRFSDMTEEEYSAMLGRREPTRERPEGISAHIEGASYEPIDWTKQGAVTKVKDQGQCGSCYAFSATGALEGAHFLSSGKLQSFSEQQVVDCDKDDGGCNGGNQDVVFQYWYDYDWPTLEQDYPYTSGNGRRHSCQYSKSKATRVEVTDWKFIKAKDPNAMKAALKKDGPLAVSVDAESRAWNNYRSGVLDSSSCGTSLDHAVLLVGWGTHNGQEYWKVKNSWADDWGEDGYIRLAIEEGKGICGVQKEPIAVYTSN